MKTKSFELIEKNTGEFHLLINTPDEKVNILSQAVFKELEQVINSLEIQKTVQILFIRSAKPGTFIAGANVGEIRDIEDITQAEELSRNGKILLDRLAKLTFPTVAVINGVCLGGGLELALACTFRIATDDPKTKIGLPEVQLGILPGLGGTQRLPRLTGLQNALPMILSGAPVNAKKAKRIHLVDEIYHQEYLDTGIERFKKLVLEDKGKILKRRKQKGLTNVLLERNSLGRKLIYRKAKASILAKGGNHYPAPLLALKSIQKGFNKRLKRGMDIETRLFGQLAVSDVSKNLIRLFFTSQHLKKQAPGSNDKITKLAILGAGVMGGMIAWLFNYKKMRVSIKDINWEAIAKGFKACRNAYNYHIKKRKLKLNEVEMRMLLLSGQTDYKGFKQHDLVIEAIPEDLQLKLATFRQLEQNIGEHTIIASNTSSISINRMAAGLKHPERFIGMHFFNPVNRMPLVEIIPGSKTAPGVVAKAVQLIQSVGKIPIVVKDCPGFLVNRILLPYLDEASHLLIDGVAPERIDHIMRNFGMPMGPIELLDEIGLDTAYKVIQIFESNYGYRMSNNGLLEQVIKTANMKGKKSGQGFYTYAGKKRIGKNKQVEAIIQEIRTKKQKRLHIPSGEEIQERLLLGMINEAFRCMEEQVVASEDMLDFAMINGTGFPPYTGGPICYARSLGVENVYLKLKKYAYQLGNRFTPCAFLEGDEKNADQEIYTTVKSAAKKSGSLQHS